MRYTSLGFFSSQGSQRNIQLARTLAGLNDYLADLERRFIVSGQHPNHILVMLPGGEDRTGLLAPVRQIEHGGMPVRSPLCSRDCAKTLETSVPIKIALRRWFIIVIYDIVLSTVKNF